MSAPKDQSLPAFKEWIQGVTKAINPDAKPTTTEAEWERDWKAFWSK